MYHTSTATEAIMTCIRPPPTNARPGTYDPRHHFGDADSIITSRFGRLPFMDMQTLYDNSQKELQNTAFRVVDRNAIPQRFDGPVIDDVD